MGALLRRCVVCHVSYPGTERFCPIDGGAIVEEQPAASGSRVGQTIDGRYLVRRLLGRGGMGEVYEADHVGLDKRVAIKFVTGDNTNKNALARFRREARVASKIVHEHVVHIYDVGTDNDVDYIVMEYLEGKDLKQRLADEGKLAPARAVAIARQMLAGLHAIHQAGILHRDIKPANVLLTTRGGDRDYVKIMDFGISKALGGDDGLQLTGTGNVIGTPQYIAPEIFRGVEVDHRADLYAVGITLYAMLAGDVPFDDPAFDRLIAMHLTERAPDLTTVRDDVSPSLAAAVARALAKSPDDRFADATAFADALAVEAPTTPPVTRDRPRSLPEIEIVEPRPLWPFAIAALLVIIGGVAIALVVRSRGDDVVAVVPSDAAVDAAVDALTPADELLVMASKLEAEKQYELAAVQYVAAFATQPDPEYLRRAADAYVNAGKPAKAIEQLDRYLALPDAKDRVAADTQKKHLEISLIDAGVPEPDLPFLSLDAGGPVTAIEPTGMYCGCDPVDSGTSEPLCAKAAVEPRCMCLANQVNPLCPTPFVTCKGCEAHQLGCKVPECESDGWKCASNPRFATWSLPGKPDEKCHGYPRQEPTVQRAGVYDCSFCPEIEVLEFRGQLDDTCQGFRRADGKRFTGRLARCRPTPP